MTDDRLAKLLMMLSSDRVGEVAAAAKAIERHLKAHGHHWHDLAKWLSADRPPVPYTPPPRPTYHPPAPRRPTYGLRVPAAEMAEIVDCIRRNHFELTERAADFLFELA